MSEVYFVGVGEIPKWLTSRVGTELNITEDERGDWLVQLPDRALVLPKHSRIALQEDGRIYFDATEVVFNG